MLNSVTSVKPRRPYRSPVREQAALRSREAVVVAAHQVFVEHGYASATIDAIARRAGVSRPTVFAVGTKPQLLALARLKAIEGEHLVSNDQRFRDVLAIPDPHQLLRRFAAFTADIARRLGPLTAVLEQAAPGDSELTELLERSQRDLHRCARAVASALHSAGALTGEISVKRAADVIWLLIQPTQYQRLVTQQRWTHRAYERWHADAMVRLLIDPDRGSTTTGRVAQPSV
jgi:AcrR family transcriptional regulator